MCIRDRFYRISDMDGKPFAGIDYNGDGTADEYGEVTIPANYDASSSAFEIDPEGHVILVDVYKRQIWCCAQPLLQDYIDRYQWLWYTSIQPRTCY